MTDASHQQSTAKNAAPEETSGAASGLLDVAALVEKIDKPVVLIGLMRAGKSTVGRRLAAKMGRDFVDADDAIEDAAQRFAR